VTEVRQVLRLLLRILLLPLRLVRLVLLAHRYRRMTVTDPVAYYDMLEAFSLTGGVTNDLLCRLLNHPRQVFSHTGLLGAPNSADIEVLITELQHKGYLVFPSLLDEKTCDELTRFALSISGVANAMDEGEAHQPPSGIYRRDKPTSTKFHYDASRILENHNVQKLLVDNSLLSLIQGYLGSLPIVDIVTMWWTSAFKSSPDCEAAQSWHFDMDRPKWLKVFFYLTDVGPENGPHSFIEGTHRRFGIPFALRSKGYVRLTDEEISNHFTKERIVQMTGKRGTVIVEDTRGLHKGMPVITGDRLILQFEYCVSLYGGKLPLLRFPVSEGDSFRRQRAETPDVFEAFE